MDGTDIRKIHDASLAVLASQGVAFHSPDVVDLFREKGFETDGRRVLFTEKQVWDAVESAPSDFNLAARNPDRDLTLGRPGRRALVPAYGPPFIIDANGLRRNSTFRDYQKLCMLTQSSDVINMNGYLMCEPTDLDPKTSHLDLLLAGITLCDKPLMGSPISKTAAVDSVNMAALLGADAGKPMMIANTNSLSPLGFSAEIADSLVIFAEHGQPVVVMGGGIMGSTAPIHIAGLLVNQNAAVLAGVVLAQAVNPGSPVIYAAGGTPMDMRTGAYYLAAPEFCQAIRAGAEMARFYGLPLRSGGCLTDAWGVDFQAGYQSALTMGTALESDADFVLHSCGILGSYLAVSLEKFVADEDILRFALKAMHPPEISTETLSLEAIAEVGPGGQFLTHPTTFAHCRTAFDSPALAGHETYDSWIASPRGSYEQRAAREVEERLAAYEKPAIDQGLEQELKDYVTRRKGELE